MRPYLRINLCLSSLLASLLLACSPASGYKFVRTGIITTKEVRPIVNENNSLLYKAGIDLYNKHYSGLIILKQVDKNSSHLTFVTEIGMKLFDFEIRDTSFKLVYVFEPLNKPGITRLLESDMKLILLQHLLDKEATVYEKRGQRVYKVKEDARYYYRMNTNSGTVKTTTKKGKLFTKVKVNYLYNDSLDASRIRLKHKGLIRLKIEFSHLDKPDAR